MNRSSAHTASSGQAPDTPAQRQPLDGLVRDVVDSYRAVSRTQHINATFLPSRDKAIGIITLLRQLLFPGFFGKQKLTSQNIRFHTAALLEKLREALDDEIDSALRYAHNLQEHGSGDACDHCSEKARQTSDTFLEKVPELRRQLALDIQAAYDGDPAARNTDETIFCYPGVYAVFVYRIAHELFKLGVPLLPRIMSEHAHEQVGVDIHPGATIGESFFIDHATGVVIGETTVIGNRVKLYQGVTLGALSFAKDERGRLIRGTKRHPTIEDEVIIYANATILGGNTIVGRGCEIGANVFLTKSVPPGHVVTMKPPELRYRAARKPGAPPEEQPVHPFLDYQI